jgi:hypothetical protein
MKYQNQAGLEKIGLMSLCTRRTEIPDTLRDRLVAIRKDW